jgi:hypothetical protein
MTSLRVYYGLFASTFLLCGCPPGAGRDVFRQDGGDEVDAEAGASDDPGARCGPNGTNACGPYAICDPALGCVECASADDCPVAAAHCLAGACVVSRPGMTDCPAGTTCWASDYECHPRCAGAGSCPGGTACDESSGECVGCSAALPCATGVCALDRRRCVECLTEETCPAARPRCHAGRGECVRCTSNDDCGVTAPFCDPVRFACSVPDAADSGVSDAGGG